MTRTLLPLLSAALLFALVAPDASAQRRAARAATFEDMTRITATGKTRLEMMMHHHVIEITYKTPEAAQRGEPSEATITVRSAVGAPPLSGPSDVSNPEIWYPTTFYASSTMDPYGATGIHLERDANGLITGSGMIPAPMEIETFGLDSPIYNVMVSPGLTGAAAELANAGPLNGTAREERKEARQERKQTRFEVRMARKAARGHVKSVEIDAGLNPPRFKITIERYPPTFPQGDPNNPTEQPQVVTTLMD